MAFEKVNPSHPDKIADRIGGAIVDLAYKKAARPKVAVEVLIGHNRCHIINETSEHFELDEIKAIVNRIADVECEIDYHEVPQDKHLADNQSEEIRCGDNGIFKGVPTNEEEKMLSKIVRELYTKYPTDGKYILDTTSETATFIGCQSHITDEEFVEATKDIPAVCVLNPLGEWTGGVNVDSGATNRKLGSDMGRAATGGGMCVSGDTEYLGEDLQWHRIDEYDGGKVAQFNEETGEAEFVQPNAYIHNKDSQFIVFENDTKLAMKLTPDHQVLIQTSKGNWIKHTADEVAKVFETDKGNLGKIPHAFKLKTNSDNSLYSSEAALRLQIAFCADGSIIRGGNKWTGCFNLKKEYKRERVIQLLNEAGIEYRITEMDKYGYWHIYFRPEVLNKSLRACCQNEDLAIVYDEIFRWDGDENRKVFRTTKLDDADFAQLVIASQGHAAGISVSDRVGSAQIINGKEYIRKSILYTVSEYKSGWTMVRSNTDKNWDVTVERQDDPEDSYCFNVPSHNLVLRWNGEIFITGNCGKELSKADVSVNIACHILAQDANQEVTAFVAIGDTEVEFKIGEKGAIVLPYAEVVKMAGDYIANLGGFEKFAEWGLI